MPGNGHANRAVEGAGRCAEDHRAPSLDVAAFGLSVKRISFSIVDRQPTKVRLGGQGTAGQPRRTVARSHPLLGAALPAAAAFRGDARLPSEPACPRRSRKSCRARPVSAHGSRGSDPRLPDNWQGGTRAAMPRGTYHVYYFCCPAEELAVSCITCRATQTPCPRCSTSNGTNGHAPAPTVPKRVLVDHVIAMASAQQVEEVAPALRAGRDEPGKMIVADLRADRMR